MQSATGTILVVGAGVFGLAAALELRRRGHAVSLLDPGPVPHPLATSTDISKIVRMDYGDDELYTALGEEAIAGWHEWNSRWGQEVYHETGFLILTREPMRPGDFEYESFALLKRRGHDPQRVDRAILAERFPAWAADQYADGYLSTGGGWAESGKVVALMAKDARAAGVALSEEVAVTGLLEEGSRVVGVVTAGGDEQRADCVVVAAGAWTPTLLPHLGDVMWAVGQPVLYFQPPNPDDYRLPHFPLWAADISRTGWYGFSATEDGTIKIANHGPGQLMHPDASREVAPQEEARFRRFLRDSIPELADAPLTGSRLCLYCDTWDGNFWIDRDPEREGLVVATGGSGHGFKFAPVLGGIIADVVERKPNPHAARFAWRSRGEPTSEAARYTG